MSVYGECLYRQGWWTRKFDNVEEALDWSDAMVEADEESANPVRDVRVRVAPTPPQPALAEP